MVLLASGLGFDPNLPSPLSRTPLEWGAIEGDSPVGEGGWEVARGRVPSPGLGVGSWGTRASKAKYVPRPIANLVP